MRWIVQTSHGRHVSRDSGAPPILYDDANLELAAVKFDLKARIDIAGTKSHLKRASTAVNDTSCRICRKVETSVHVLTSCGLVSSYVDRHGKIGDQLISAYTGENVNIEQRLPELQGLLPDIVLRGANVVVEVSVCSPGTTAEARRRKVTRYLPLVETHKVLTFVVDIYGSGIRNEVDSLLSNGLLDAGERETYVKEVAGILVAQNYRIYSKFLGAAGQV